MSKKEEVIISIGTVFFQSPLGRLVWSRQTAPQAEKEIWILV